MCVIPTTPKTFRLCIMYQNNNHQK